MHAFVLFGLIQTLAMVSGAHFNPAVTVVMTALRQIKPPTRPSTSWPSSPAPWRAR